MLKIGLLSLLLILFWCKVPAQTPGKLLSAIQKSKEDTSRISLQLKLGNYYHFKSFSNPQKSGEYKHYQDSASNLFNQALKLSIKLHETDWQYRALAMLAESEGESNPAQAKRILLQAITHYHKKGNLGEEARAWQRLADMYFTNTKFNDKATERISHYQHARALYLQNHELIHAASILTDIAANRLAVQQFDLAEKELRQSLAEYKALGYKKLQYTYMTLVDLEYGRGNNYQAIQYCLQGIRNTMPGENIRYTSYFYWNAARCNYSGKKYEKALDWIRKAIDMDSGYPEYKYFLVETLLELNRTKDALATIKNIAEEKFPHTSWDTLNLYRSLALYHAKKNNTNLTIRYYHKILEMAGKVFGEGGYSWRILCSNGIAEAYLKSGQATNAGKYINDVALIYEKAKKNIDPALLVNFYTNSFKYNPANGNYRAAFRNAKIPLYLGPLENFYYNSYKFNVAIGDYRAAITALQRHVKLHDSLFTVERDNKVAELQVQYQTAEKEQAIKFLHSQSAVQQARVENADLQKNITIGGILMMILVSALFYRNYKQKQAANNTITQKNELLQHLLSEKELLLKEVHHRIKNNLHTVICLLESQARYLEDDALKAIETSQHRIYAMSLIHQKLYQSDDLKTIDMATYVPELVQSLIDGFGTSGKIVFKLNIESINLNLSHAIPLALIINEAVTNSIKYAFPDNKKGEISISMANDGTKITLELEDNGIGISQVDQETEMESLGLRLIMGLSEDIEAQIRFEVSNGTRINVIFRSDTLNDRDSLLTLTNTTEMYI